MSTSHETLIDLEKKFWQSLVSQDADAAAALLAEPALMVSAHGTMKFDHAAYRKMLQQGSMLVTAFEFTDVDVLFPNDATAIVTYRVRQTVAPRGRGESTVQEMNDSSTWVRTGQRWQCVMHTEAPAAPKAAAH